MRTNNVAAIYAILYNVAYMTEDNEKVPPASEVISSTESEIAGFYREILSFIQNPDNRTENPAIFAAGVKFIHDNDGQDLYMAQGLKTIYTGADGTKSRPGLIMSVTFPCELTQKHEPTEIPVRAIVDVQLPGMTEHFLIDGTLNGSKVVKGVGKSKTESEIRKADLETYKAYLRAAKFEPLKVELSPF